MNSAMKNFESDRGADPPSFIDVPDSAPTPVRLKFEGMPSANLLLLLLLSPSLVGFLLLQSLLWLLLLSLLRDGLIVYRFLLLTQRKAFENLINTQGRGVMEQIN
mmetsp:Transcript_98/g.163  ORF Transcript_98/g.163 Transcript_98/m.163 type:complete len:105 (-) Transcript_98:30-344(-)